MNKSLYDLIDRLSVPEVFLYLSKDPGLDILTSRWDRILCRKNIRKFYPLDSQEEFWSNEFKSRVPRNHLYLCQFCLLFFFVVLKWHNFILVSILQMLMMWICKWRNHYYPLLGNFLQSPLSFLRPLSQTNL